MKASSPCIQASRAVMKRGTLLIITGFLAGMALFLAARPAADPSYNGRTLSQWIDRAASGGGAWGARAPEVIELDQAVSHLGRSALPVLVRKLGEEGWLSQVTFSKLQRRLPRRLQTSHLFLVLQRKVAEDETRAYARSSVAARALASLGTNAQPALPALMRLFRKQHSYFVSYSAGEAIAGIGKPALPEVFRCLSDPGFAFPLAAVQLLGQMRGVGEAAGPAVPILCQKLHQRDSTLATACAETLAELRASADRAVPALSETLITAVQETNVLLSRKCAEALGIFGITASNAVPALCFALKSIDGITTEEAARALGRIGARQDLAVPALIDYLKASGLRHHKYAIEGLSGYSEAAQQIRPLLRAAVSDEDHDTRAIARQALARIGLDDPEPVTGP